MKNRLRYLQHVEYNTSKGKYAQTFSDWICRQIRFHSEKLSPYSNTIGVTFPFVDSHNDFIQIFVFPHGNMTNLVTDNAYFYMDLFDSGIDL